MIVHNHKDHLHVTCTDLCIALRLKHTIIKNDKDMLALKSFFPCQSATNGVVIILAVNSSIMVWQLTEATADLIKDEVISHHDVHSSFSLFYIFSLFTVQNFTSL